LIEELKTLSEMQKLDTRLMEHERKRVEAPKRLAELEQELLKTKDKIAREKEIIEELDGRRR
jgi:predicted  nucleic acid-binding Zn-ribbon protein